MSITVFWSPIHGQGQTSNLHVTAAIMGLVHRKKVLMMQTHFQKNNLEGPLVGKNTGLYNEDNELFQDIGLDAAITFSNMSRLDSRALESCCLTFQDTSLMLLPGTDIKNRETFDRDIGSNVIRMIKKADAFTDIVLIDANSGDDELSFRLMAIADLVVINLTQRRHVLKKYITDYSGYFKDKKVFFLFGDYDDNSICNINNCRTRFNKYIKKYNSGVIPYCTEYMDAQNESNILAFIRNGFRIRRAVSVSRVKNLMRGIVRTGRYSLEEKEYFLSRSLAAVEKMLALMNSPEITDNREGAVHEHK